MKKLTKPTIIIVLIGLILGVLSFLFIYGAKTLNPTYTDWLLNYGNTTTGWLLNYSDATTHFLGWSFFRHDPWSFPLGRIISYAYPFGTTITYTDSIPLLALIFKLFRSILPQTWQYFGLWEILCFGLQGVFAALILRLYTKNIFLITISTLFFIFSPIMIGRAFGQSSLSSHFIILAALYLLLLALEKKMNINLGYWIMIALLSILIHPYFTLMVMIIYLGYEINDYVINKKITHNLIRVGVVILSLILVSFAIGVFSSGVSLDSIGLGNYSLNLDSLFNPMGWSKYFLKDIPLATNDQYEGFSYLGLGMIILLIGTLTIYAKEVITKDRTNQDKDDRASLGKKISLIFIVGLILILSLSNRITLFSHTLFTIPLPNFIVKLWSIFRATGRLFWPVFYLIYIFIFIQLFRFFKGRKLKYGLAILLALIFVIQTIDMSHILAEKREFFAYEQTYTSPLKSSFWQDAPKAYQHLIVFSAPPDYTFPIFAMANKMTINNATLARGPYEKMIQYAKEKIKLLESGDLDNDELYIIKDQKIFEEMKFSLNENLNTFLVDGYIVICSKKDLIKNYYPDNFERIRFWLK